ncbi:esterase SG1-like [Bicyclus anynana]|uniref:Esterase SG1-like n=1 Tax=Bicyclus anynana TaxID=110368 RepID=A0ABM3LYP5_BICAN|nr:esterase SG1-like [Bicyclus anynana]
MSPRWGMFLLPVLCNWWSGVAAPLHRLVVTTQGAVRGYYAPQPPHYVYRGVPYARPPTNYDRFKAPEPPPPWSGIFEATHRVRCPQPDGSGEENCLVLNIFVPERAAASPVLVHFHGGGFQRGWGFHTGPRRLLEQGFVVVSFNYRLGVLGFLCLGLPDVLGNTGLKDQIAALYWIHRNIDKFGGDPGDVTAYGTGMLHFYKLNSLLQVGLPYFWKVYVFAVALISVQECKLYWKKLTKTQKYGQI